MSSGNKTICIIGGGVAGLLAAVTAADEGASVKLFEKMSKVGLKMGITGKGRCNLTNSAPIMDFIAKTHGNGKFLYSAYEKFNNEDLLDLLHGWGLKTKVERGGRVFPASDDAQEVRHLFMDLLRKKKVELHLDESVTRILTKDGEVSGIVTDKGSYGAGAVILCTGGSSYPRTGSTGDGYRMARELGHTVTPCFPALVPVNTKEDWCRTLQGLSLKNVTFTVKDGKKKLYEDFGEMLFTHFGISGPLVLSASSKIVKKLDKNPLSAFIDLKPALTDEQLDARLLRDFSQEKNKQFKNALNGLFPARLAEQIVILSGINPDKEVNAITKEERAHLVSLTKNLPLTILSVRSYNEAIITQGGVKVQEVQPKTMESKLVQGLYFAGELLDIDALTGGYNLQLAWSTGSLVGDSIV